MFITGAYIVFHILSHGNEAAETHRYTANRAKEKGEIFGELADIDTIG